METPARILIVDDEEGIRYPFSRLLARDGYKVVAVESGERALVELASQPFDVMLLDLMLGGMSGLDLLRAIRRQGLDTAVIVLIAHGSMETAIEALRQGARDYLLKPCDAVSLRASVRTALEEREQQHRQQVLLHNVEESLAASLKEIRATTARPWPGQGLAPVEATAPAPGRVLEKGIVVDVARHVVTVDEYELELSRTEFDLLAYLVKKAPQVVTARSWCARCRVTPVTASRRPTSSGATFTASAPRRKSARGAGISSGRCAAWGMR